MFLCLFNSFSIKCRSLKLVRFCVKHLFNPYSFKKGKNKTMKISFGLILKINTDYFVSFFHAFLCNGFTLSEVGK